MRIQNIYKCKHYTPNGNMNKTCDNSKRCCVFYEVNCQSYSETEDRKEVKDNG